MVGKVGRAVGGTVFVGWLVGAGVVATTLSEGAAIMGAKKRSRKIG